MTLKKFGGWCIKLATLLLITLAVGYFLGIYLKTKRTEPTSTPKFEVGDYVKIKFNDKLRCAVRLHRWEEQTMTVRYDYITFYYSWLYYLQCNDEKQHIVEEYFLDKEN